MTEWVDGRMERPEQDRLAGKLPALLLITDTGEITTIEWILDLLSGPPRADYRRSCEISLCVPHHRAVEVRIVCAARRVRSTRLAFITR